MHKAGIYILLFWVALSFIQCDKATEPKTNDDLPGPPGEVQKEVIASSNLFGFSLFKEVIAREDPDSNVFISPLSASFALGMAFNGAAMQTREEMRQALAYGSLTTTEINESYRYLIDNLTQLDPAVSFEIANGIWYRQNKAIEPSFIDLCMEYFNSLVMEVDFQDPAVPAMINDWVSEATHGHIDTIITPPISGDLALLMANAIYFKGGWTDLFDTINTHTESFFINGYGHPPINCRMMYRDDTILYLENDLFRAVDLPYGDEAFSMTVILPNYGYTTDDIIEQLTVDNWAKWNGEFSEVDIRLGLPKFKFAYETGLNEMLKAMGMIRAFSPDLAQFYNMFEDNIGWIDTVFQKAFVQVDESGTEAAAVTVIEFYDGLPPGLHADRPFLFVIHEHESGTILFMGKVADPVWDD